MKKSTKFLAATLAITVSMVALSPEAHADDPKHKRKKSTRSQTSSKSVEVNYGALDKFKGKPASRDPQLQAEVDKARAAIGSGPSGQWQDPGASSATSGDNVPVVIRSAGDSKTSRDPKIGGINESSFVTPDNPVKEEPLTGLRRRPVEQPAVIDMDSGTSNVRARQNQQYMDDFKRDMAAPPSDADVVEQSSSFAGEDVTVFQPVPEKATKSITKSADVTKPKAKKKKKKAKKVAKKAAPKVTTPVETPSSNFAEPTPTQDNINSVIDTLPPVAPAAEPAPAAPAPVAPALAPAAPAQFAPTEPAPVAPAAIPPSAPVAPTAPIVVPAPSSDLMPAPGPSGLPPAEVAPALPLAPAIEAAPTAPAPAPAAEPSALAPAAPVAADSLALQPATAPVQVAAEPAPQPEVQVVKQEGKQSIVSKVKSWWKNRKSDETAAPAATPAAEPVAAAPAPTAAAPVAPQPEIQPIGGTTATTAAPAPAGTAQLVDGKVVIEPAAPALNPVDSTIPTTLDATAPAPAAAPAEAPIPPVVVTTPAAIPPSAPTAVPAAPVAPLASVAPTGASTSAVALPANVMAMVNFTKEQVELTPTEQQQFASTVEMMKSDPNRRINIISYATSTDAQNSTARRISLKRALAVRKYLIGQGIDTVRINVQAMGNAAQAGTPADRVDVLLVANS